LQFVNLPFVFLSYVLGMKLATLLSCYCFYTYLIWLKVSKELFIANSFVAVVCYVFKMRHWEMSVFFWLNQRIIFNCNIMSHKFKFVGFSPSYKFCITAVYVPWQEWSLCRIWLIGSVERKLFLHYTVQSCF
jgi:hypothetical protein